MNTCFFLFSWGYDKPIFVYTNKNLTLPPLKTLDLGSPVITSIFVEGNADPQQVFGSLGIVWTHNHVPFAGSNMDPRPVRGTCPTGFRALAVYSHLFDDKEIARPCPGLPVIPCDASFFWDPQKRYLLSWRLSKRRSVTKVWRLEDFGTLGSYSY